MTNQVPTIAAIVPNYNYAAFLPKAIDSLLGQTIPFDEIIVVDDGSTDNSLAVIATYGDKIRGIAKANGGQLSCCLLGLRMSRSDYIYVLDADDWVRPDMCAELAQALTQWPAKIQFLLQGTDVNGVPKGSSFPQYPAGYDTEQMRQDNSIMGFYLGPPTSGNVFRKEVLEQIDLSRLDQRDFIDGTPALAMPYFGEVITVQKALGYYRIHHGSDSDAMNIVESVPRREISRFLARWEEMENIVGIPKPFGAVMPFILAERYLVIAALQGRRFLFRQALVFIKPLYKSHFSSKQKLVLAIWATLLMIPVSTLRIELIKFRRAGTSRPVWLKTVLDFVNRQ
jgi:glycosyltransferase involved in cell wall biosynthesis